MKTHLRDILFALTCLLLLFHPQNESSADLSSLMDTASGALLHGEETYTHRVPHVDESRPVIRLLFIGNSYTFYHTLPDMIPWIAASVPTEKFSYRVDMVASGGAHLREFAMQQPLLDKIAKPGYQAVILQEQSVTAVSAAEIPASLMAINVLTAQAKKSGAEVFIYGTWPRKAGDAIYKGSPQLKEPKDMLAYIDRHFQLAAKNSGALYVPVGDYWFNAQQKNPALNLYEQDGSHPNLQASYLSALVLYRYISGTSPLDVTWAPNGMAPDQASALRAMAAETL